MPIGYIDGLTGTVVSYRGTNFDTGDSVFEFFNSPLWQDMRNGWIVGAGLPGLQAAFALDFYNAVAPDDVDPRYANITTTGHSLGGGLAGFAANVFNREAVLFDHMPFTPISATLNTYLDARARFFGGDEIWEFSDAGVTAFSTENEVLAAVRQTISSEEYTPINSHGGLRNPVTLHSMSLLVSLLWAEENGGTEWQAAGEQLWNGFFDGIVAAGLPGIQGRVGQGSNAAAAMEAVIAYSALGAGEVNEDGNSTEGEKPFGDTAIWSMFDDAGDLGAVLAGTESKFFDDKVTERAGLIFNTTVAVKQAIANFLVQYAGALALYDVEQKQGTKTTVEGGSVDVREGILSRDTATSALTLDLSRQLWKDALGGNTVSPIDRDKFRQAFFKAAEDPSLWSSFKRLFGMEGGTQFGDAELKQLAKETWGTENLDIFDRFHMAPTDTATTVTLDARGYLSNNSLGDLAQVDVYLGSAANETIINKTNGHNLIITGDGTDVVDAGGGNDVVFSQGGSDQLDGGEGNDRVAAIGDGKAVTAGGLGIPGTVYLFDANLADA